MINSDRRLTPCVSSDLLRAGLGAVLVALFAITSTAAFAQLPYAQLISVFPPSGRPGEQVEVQIEGADLDGANRLVFSHAGITAVQKTGIPHPFTETPAPVPHRFIVQIADDVPVGAYDVRAIGRYGGSNPRVFVVSDQNHLVEDKLPGANNNHSPTTPADVEIGSVVSGRVARDQIDYFRFHAKKGQRILINCLAQRIDSRLDATLVLLGPDGNELDRVQDTVNRDPVMAFTAAEDAQFVVGVHDYVYRGGSACFYQLSFGEGPHVEAVFPPVVVPGSTNRLTLYGRNLPGGLMVAGDESKLAGLEQVDVDVNIPDVKDSASQVSDPVLSQVSGFLGIHRWSIDTLPFQWHSTKGNSNQVRVGIASAPIVKEIEPNDKPADAQKLSLPCEVVGQFHPRGDVDWVEFEAKTDDVVWIDVVSHRMGARTDAYLVVEKVTTGPDGKPQTGPQTTLDETEPIEIDNQPLFEPLTYDPTFRLIAEEDATYRVGIRDLYAGSRGDPRMTYRLIVRPADPDFRVAVHSSPYRKQKSRSDPSSLVLRQGDRGAMMVHVFRHGGLKEDVQVTAEGLPDGVTCYGAVVGGAVDTSQLVFAAQEGTAAWSGPVRIIGRASIDGKEVIREGRGVTLIGKTDQDEQRRSVVRSTQEVWLSVISSETASAVVSTGQNLNLETSLGGKLQIPVSIERRGQFVGSVKLVTEGLPGIARRPEINVAGSDGKMEIAFSNRQIPLGTYTIFLRGNGSQYYLGNIDAIAAAKQHQQEIQTIRDKMISAADTASNEKQAAERVVKAAAEKLQQAQQMVEEAERTVESSKDVVEGAVDQRQVALVAAQKEPANQDLSTALSVAEAAVAESTNVQRQSAEELKVARAAVVGARRASDAAQAKWSEAEKVLAESEDRKRKANELKQEADQRLAKVKITNSPKGVDFGIVSTPVRIRVAGSPVVLRLAQQAMAVVPGQEVVVPIAIDRKYGFDERVVVEIDSRGVGGLNANEITIDKSISEGELRVRVDEKVVRAEYPCQIKARLRFNGLDLSTTEAFVLQVVDEKP